MKTMIAIIMIIPTIVIIMVSIILKINDLDDIYINEYNDKKDDTTNNDYDYDNIT